jgi:PHD/YefM family antitoxin component YafN of YafNO toxin-antitoxin module
MNVKYVTDDSGKRSAVIVPLKEWESIMGKINDMREDLEALSPEDEIDRRAAYGELNRGETLNLREAVKNW